MDQDCIFCKIASGQIPSLKIFENDHILAFIDIGPVSDGHTLVIPKQHYGTLDQMTPEIMAEIAKVLPMLAASIQKAMKSEGYNVLCNNGSAAGQIVEHIHFHIIPRNANDGIFKKWPSFQYPDGKAEQIAAKIRENLSL
ncbi:MAG: HIT family protein [Planctomycetes bacterium]|nr:HIT family protein [Planctomycetota bacterium]